MPISATIITVFIQFLQIIHSPMTRVHMETIQIFRWAHWEWSYPYSSRRSVPWSICFHHENWSDHNSLLFMKISCGVGRPGCHAPATAMARVTMKSHCQETWEKRNHCEPAPELLHMKNKSPRARQLPRLLIKLRDDPADPFSHSILAFLDAHREARLQKTTAYSQLFPEANINSKHLSSLSQALQTRARQAM